MSVTVRPAVILLPGFVQSACLLQDSLYMSVTVHPAVNQGLCRVLPVAGFPVHVSDSTSCC